MKYPRHRSRKENYSKHENSYFIKITSDQPSSRNSSKKRANQSESKGAKNLKNFKNFQNRGNFKNYSNLKNFENYKSGTKRARLEKIVNTKLSSESKILLQKQIKRVQRIKERPGVDSDVKLFMFKQQYVSK